MFPLLRIVLRFGIMQKRYPHLLLLRMSQNQEINSLSPELQALVRREVERQLKAAKEKEAELPLLDDLPILQQLGAAPRDLSLAVRLYLRLCSSPMPFFFGYVFAGFGLVFALLAVALMGLDDVIPRNWTDAGKGKITNIEESNATVNDRRIYAYHWEMTDNGMEKVSGISYGYSGKHKIDDEALIQKAGTRYRIQGLTLTSGGWIPIAAFFGMGSLFGVIGLCFPVYSWFAGGKTIHLLRDGTAAGARFRGMNPTNMQVNGRSVMKVDFEYQVDGETYTASAEALDTSRLTDTPCKAVLYDTMEPSRSLVLDGLPGGLHLDELTGRFWVNPLRCVLPLLAATIVCAEIIAIVVFAVRAI